MLVNFARTADFDCFLVAGRYTLLDQSGLTELLPLCSEKGIGIIVGGVYNSGILADPDRSPLFDYRPAKARWIAKVERIQRICNRYDTPLKAAAIQFPLSHPAVTCVLTGCRSVAELEENLKMLEYEIPSAVWDALRFEGLLPESAPTPH